MSSNSSDAGRVVGRTVRITLAIVVTLALAVALMFATGTIQRLTADWRGETDAIEKTSADGDYRIAAYDSFYDLNSRVEALDTQICTMKASTGLPKDQRATNVLALTNTRTDLVNQYNADARKSATRGEFRASDLPYQLPKDYPTC